MAGPNPLPPSGVAGATGRLLAPCRALGPSAWRLAPRAFELAAERALSRRIDFRAVLKQLGRAEAESRCAEAREDLLARPVPVEVATELERWCTENVPRSVRGIVVRVFAEWDVGLPDPSRCELARATVSVEGAAVVKAVQRGWASALTLEALQRCVDAGARDIDIALALESFDVDPFVATAPDAEFRVEVVGGRVAGGPLGALSHSVVVRLTERSAVSALRSLGLSADEPRRLVRTAGGRSWIELHDLVARSIDMPLIEPADVGYALGVPAATVVAVLTRREPSPGRPVRRAFRAAALLAREGRLLRDLEATERQLLRDLRTLEEIDLTLLPTDGVATTLSSVAQQVERSGEAIVRTMVSQFALTVGVRGLLRRVAADATLSSAATILSGSGAPLGLSLLQAFARTVDVLRGDPAAREAVAGGVRVVEALPDGAGKTALRQFLTGYGDVAAGAFDLERPRWREDPFEVIDALARWLAHPEASAVAIERARERTRARADGELARFEPALGWAERHALRLLIDRAKGMARVRASLDRLALRALALLRKVALDADRRLRRVDSEARSGGAFASSLEGLMAALRTNRPELGAVIAMHDAEWSEHAREPRVVVAAARGTDAHKVPDVLRGSGVSAGVCDARIRLAEGGVPFESEQAVLVMSQIELAVLPRVAGVGAIVATSGTPFSSASETLRELGLPCVVVAASGLSAGEFVRVDGERGVVERFEGGRGP